MSTPAPQPLVYACSGCSSVAQLANDLAVRLDRSGQAEMSCISGVGGGVGPLVKLARSGRPILALDGCALACVKACLAQAGVTPASHTIQHLVLNRHGVKKRLHTSCNATEHEMAWQQVQQALEEFDQPRPATEPSAD